MSVVLRRLLPPAALLAALATPAAAQAATTYSVDPDAANGCTGAVCKTIAQAIGAANAGDTISIKAGNYSEAPLVVADDDITITAATAGTVSLTSQGGADGTPVLTLNGSGAKVSGFAIAVPTNGGPAVRVAGTGGRLEGLTLVNQLPTSQDLPTLDITALSGRTTVKTTAVFHDPGRTGSATAPAVRTANALASVDFDTLGVLSGAKGGPAVQLQGNEDGVRNRIVSSQILSQGLNSDALQVRSRANNGTKKLLRVDATVLSAGRDAAGLAAETDANFLLPPSGAGDIDVDLVHVTIAGSQLATYIKAGANSNTTTGIGNVDVAIERSIVYGANTVENYDGLLGIGANDAKLSITASDSPQSGQAEASGSEILVGANQNSGEAKLFRDTVNKDFRLRADAPAIDKAGPVLEGEYDKDLEGQPRVFGAASDMGADEFVNQGPITRVASATAAGKAGEPIAFDASASSDPEAGEGGTIIGYRWVWGDGKQDVTSTPTATHAYEAPGSYTVRVQAIDNFTTPSAQPATVAVAVADSAGPNVAFATPRTGTTFRRFATKTVTDKKTKKKRKVRGKAQSLRIAGTADDTTGLDRVELSIRVTKVISSTGKTVSTKAGQCRFFDPATRKVVGRPCDKPISFRVSLKEGLWAYNLKGSTSLRLGRYVVTATGYDKAGNRTSRALGFNVR